MTSDPVIVLPDLKKSSVVQCDACGGSIGAVLMQDDRVVAYESRILQGPKKTMHVCEKELSAVIYGLLSWKHYLLGADFVVQTDYQTLRYFLTQAKLFEKHMRWANILSMFHFQIVHGEGKNNVVADALSRKPQISAVSIPYHYELDDMREQYANDEDFARIFEQLMDGQRYEHYLLKDGFMMMHGRLCVTRPLRHKVIEECHVPPYAGHRGIDATVKAVETFFYWPTLRRDVDAFVRACTICQQVKFDRQRAPGLLQPSPIPDKPWESIAMDFIFARPRTQTENDAAHKLGGVPYCFGGFVCPIAIEEDRQGGEEVTPDGSAFGLSFGAPTEEDYQRSSVCKLNHALWTNGCKEFSNWRTEEKEALEALKEFIEVLLSGCFVIHIEEELYGFGARKFALVSLSVIGCIPLELLLSGIHNGSCNMAINQEVQRFNSDLLALALNLQAVHHDAVFTYVNSYDIVAKVIENPVEYGFKYAAEACCGAGPHKGLPCYRAISSVCANASEYLFWDFAHPTEALNTLLANKYWRGAYPEVSSMNLQEMFAL
ncbi:hypothetical protein L7F22_030204 [Adiantum nelumboides]|nr:hypothetical protein [Adiantum nelumboides]